MGEWKDTELGPLPEHWDVASFETMLKDGFLSYGVVQPGQEVADGVPMIRVNNITNGQVVLDQVLRIDPSREQAHAKTRLNGDELLISVVGSLGDTVLCDERLKGFNVARAIAVARFKDDDDRRWACYALKVPEVKASILSFANTTVQPTLNLKELRGIPIPLPPPSERMAIASVLSSLDAKIDLLHRQNKTLEAMAETLFRQWFVEEAEEEWEEKTVADIAEVTSGKRPPERFEVATSKARVPVWGGNGPMAYTREALVDSEVLLTGRVGTLGSIFRINTPIWPSDNTLLLTARRPEAKEFLFQQLKSIDFAQLNRGSTQPLLTQSDLKAQSFSMPPDELLLSYHEISRDLYAKVDANLKANQTLTALRDTLLPKLMSGEVRVGEQ